MLPYKSILIYASVRGDVGGNTGNTGNTGNRANLSTGSTRLEYTIGQREKQCYDYYINNETKGFKMLELVLMLVAIIGSFLSLNYLLEL